MLHISKQQIDSVKIEIGERRTRQQQAAFSLQIQLSKQRQLGWVSPAVPRSTPPPGTALGTVDLLNSQAERMSSYH